MNTKVKYALVGLVVVGAVTGGYFLYQKSKEKNTKKAVDDFEETVKSGEIPASSSSSNTPNLPAPTSSGSTSSSRPKPTYKPKPANSTFPLKRGSKGVLVKDVQTALIKKHGGAILPKYGADGYYGSEMEVALAKKGLPTTIDSNTYGKIIAGKAGVTTNGENKAPKPSSASTGLSTSSTADLIYAGVIQDNLGTALKGLFQIGNVTEYIKVNEKFKKKTIHGIHKTIVNALADTFTKDYEREKYRQQLYRIGLKWRGTQWELSGLFGTVGQKLMTIKKTKVWHASGISMMVPAYTIIGTFIRGRNNLTEFRTNDGRRLYVQTIYVKYLNDEPGD